MELFFWYLKLWKPKHELTLSMDFFKYFRTITGVSQVGELCLLEGNLYCFKAFQNISVNGLLRIEQYSVTFASLVESSVRRWCKNHRYVILLRF